ncbi:hypothetical protein Tsubulata_025486, partial [Turnera subulata]
MVGPSLNTKPPATLKFLCSYGGKIVPRYPDGKLRYHGGETRVLAVDRAISFAELMSKLGELCGASGGAVGFRCQLPTEDLDALVSVTSDEDLANLIEEYDRAASLKIRAFLSLPKKSPSPPLSPIINPSPSPSSASSSKSSSSSLSSSSSSGSNNSYGATTATPRCPHQMSSSKRPPLVPAYPVKRMMMPPHYHHHHHVVPHHANPG